MIVTLGACIYYILFSIWKNKKIPAKKIFEVPSEIYSPTSVSPPGSGHKLLNSGSVSYGGKHSKCPMENNAKTALNP